MKCKILHEMTGRLRVHLCCGRMSLSQADVYVMRNGEKISYEDAVAGMEDADGTTE